MRLKLTLYRVFVMAALLLTTNLLSAQKVITGTVTDASGQPVVGSTIVVRGSTVATATDASGNFTISVPGASSRLTISSVGYEPQEISVGSRTNFPISLKTTTSTLSEVVVTGYTSQRKKDITGSVAVVNVANMNKVSTSQITNQLQGQASGVTVIGSGQPGEAPQIRIRGINTFGDNSPLYVVDGVPTTNISDLNPNDVGSLQILKDAGAASIYGSRANNGVIIITTKRGRGKTTVSYDAYYGTQVIPKGNIYNLLNPQENADLLWLALKNSGQPLTSALYGSGAIPVLPDYIYPVGVSAGDPSVDPALYNVNPEYTDPNAPSSFYRINAANKAGTDWFHTIAKNAPIQSHNLSVAGGSDKNSYLFSLNYFDQEGTVLYTYQKKLALRANTQFAVGNHIRIGENLSYTINNNPKISALTEGSIIGYAFRVAPIIPVYDIKGNFAGNFGTNLGNSFNPYATAYRSRNNKGLGNRLFGSVFGDADLLPGLTFHTSFGGESYTGYYHNFQYPTYENTENTTSNKYTEGSYYGYNWTWTNTLTYHKVIKSHDMQLLVGTEAYNEFDQAEEGSAQGYFSFDPNFTTLTTASGTPSATSSRYFQSLWSQFARLDYQFQEKYLVSATIRRDGSSKFTENNKYGYFPSVTLGWRVSQEKFMKNVSWISDLKIRGGYGILGNQINLGQNNQYATFNSDKNASYYDITGSNGSISQGFRTGQIPNTDAKWEKDINSNIGFDASLFKNKIEITADYYQKNIKDLLLNPALPGTAGAGTAPYVNIAQMHTNGFDFSITSHNNITHDLRLDATLTVTSYKNKIIKVSNGTDNFLTNSDQRRFNKPFIINQVGQASGEFYGYKVAGYWNTQAEIDAADAAALKATNGTDSFYMASEGLGRFKFADVNGDGHITDADRTFIGSPHPDFTYGINLGFSYKGFDLSTFFYGSQGNKIWNNVKYWTDLYPTFDGAKSKTALYDSWTPTHMDAAAPIVEKVAYFSTTTEPNSWYVQNGSYFRNKYMILGYTFNPKLLAKASMQSLRIYVQATNLFTITKYSGIDPEINSSATAANQVIDFGVDEGSYPNTKQFLVGINVKF